MPKYIILVPDKDLIKAMKFYNFGISKMLGTLMNWLSNGFERQLEARKDELFNKRAGAIYSTDTRLIWMRMIEQPPLEPRSPAYSVQATRNKFNAVLDNLVDWRCNTRVTSILSLEFNKHFNNLGKLTLEGKRQYWKEFDYMFKKFDRKEISLKPSSGQ